MDRRNLWIPLVITLAGCAGGAARSAESRSAESSTGATSGGEAEAAVAPQAAHPIRTTTPIPVPQPVIAREQLGPALQRVWELTEVAVAIRPPDPPTDGSLEAVDAWAAGPFATWLVARARATSAVQDATAPLEEAPAHERGIAAGLIGYLQETTCADVRGAPIPESISGDPELLRAYDEALHEALVPYARVSVQAYRFCGAAFEETQDAAWTEWYEYCGSRAGEVAQVFGVATDPGSGTTPSQIQDLESDDQ